MKLSPTGFAYTLLVLVILTASCQLSIRENDGGDGGLSADEVDTAELQKTGVTTSQDLFSDFLIMVDEVESMSKSDIDSLSVQDLLEIGEPIQRVTANTLFFSPEILDEITGPLRQLEEDFGTLTEARHTSLSNRVEQLLVGGLETAEGPRTETAGEVREILYNWASDADTTTACSDLFNARENLVLIGEGENFNIANYACSGATAFFLRSGVHEGQSVLQ
ncbi:MAG: hypothetical protein R3283_11315, partial [Balneolaceae bacterium]|nr:hypothetical protein [Balneolaceae bacterium]